MKKLLGLLLSVTLLAMVSTSALAAAHNSDGDFANHSTGRDLGITTYGSWYYIDREEPWATAVLRNNSKEDTNIGGVYYKDDFTFADVGTITSENDALIRGSYKFDNNIFVGADISGNSDLFSTISAGYVYNIDKNGWVAGSFDYGFTSNENAEDDLLGLDIDFRYYTKELRAFGQLYLGDKYSSVGDDTVLDLGVNYKIDKNLVVGAAINAAEDTEFSVGGTYTMDKLVADGRYSSADDEGLELMGMYQFTKELNAGVYFKSAEGDNDNIALKGTYALDNKSQVRMSIELDGNEEIQLAYYTTL